MQGMIQIGRRVVRSTAIAVAAALAVGGVRRARQKSYTQAPDFTPVPPPSGGGSRGFVATVEDKSNDRGFVATVEDKSNDRGFVASVEDRSNDRGFHQPAPVRVPEAGSPRPSRSEPDEPASLDSTPGEQADSAPEA